MVRTSRRGEARPGGELPGQRHHGERPVRRERRVRRVAVHESCGDTASPFSSPLQFEIGPRGLSLSPDDGRGHLSLSPYTGLPTGRPLHTVCPCFR